MLAQWKLDQDPADAFGHIELFDLCNYIIRISGCVELNMCEPMSTSAQAFAFIRTYVELSGRSPALRCGQKAMV